jgi:four helix bundle protein
VSNFPHRDMDVWRRAINAVSMIVEITNAIPARDSWLAKQIRRAAGSIVLNLGEACGEHSPFERARFLRMSRRSAYETADGLQLVKIYSRPEEKLIEEADTELGRIAAMLTKFALRCEADGIKAEIARK